MRTDDWHLRPTRLLWRRHPSVRSGDQLTRSEKMIESLSQMTAEIHAHVTDGERIDPDPR